MSTCGTCGGLIGSDFWAGTACACVPRAARHGAALHEALLEDWPFTFLDGPVTVGSGSAEALGITPKALRAVMDVERTPFNEPVMMIFGGGELDRDGNWTEYERFERPVHMLQMIQAIQQVMARPLTLEDMTISRERYELKLDDAYMKLKMKDMGPGEFDRLYKCEPMPDKHRYGPHATDPYAPGSRRRRR